MKREFFLPRIKSEEEDSPLINKKYNLALGARKLEKLNFSAEEASEKAKISQASKKRKEAVLKRNQAIEKADELNDKLIEMEMLSGFSYEEILQVYESLSLEEAKKEINMFAKEAGIKSLENPSGIIKLAKKLFGNSQKVLRISACLLVLSITSGIFKGVGDATAAEITEQEQKIDERGSKSAFSESSQNLSSDEQEKFWKNALENKYDRNYSMKILKIIAKNDQYYELFENIDYLKNNFNSEDLSKLLTEALSTAKQINRQHSIESILVNYKIYKEYIPAAKEIVEEVAEENPLTVVKLTGLRFNKRKLEFPSAKDIKKILKNYKGSDYEKITREAFEVVFLLNKKLSKKDFPLDRKKILSTFKCYFGEKTYNSAKNKKNDFNEEYFEKIFFSNSFQNKIKKEAKKAPYSYMNTFSIAKAVFRYLMENQQELNEENIHNSTDLIFNMHEAVKEIELFGPETKLILFAHEEMLGNIKIIKDIFYFFGGRDENIIISTGGMNMQGEKNLVKENVLKAIRNAKKGKVTIAFSGHGSEKNWSFSRNESFSLDNSLESKPRSINYEELANALFESGNMENINLIGDTCYSYDYIKNLQAHLKKNKKTTMGPRVAIASSNLSEPSDSKSFLNDGVFFDALKKTGKKGKAMKVENFFKAESLVWMFQDPAIFINEKLDNKMGEDYKTIELGMNNEEKDYAIS